MKSPDAEALRSGLSIPEMLRSTGAVLRQTPDGWRGPCPACGGSEKATKYHVSRDGAFAKCFGCDLAGDVFTWIGAIHRVGFVQALELAADLLGAPARLLAAPTRPNPVSRRPDSDDASERRNRLSWNRLAHWHPAGAAYLQARGIDAPGPTAVRFQQNGAVCLPLRDMADGHIVNVVKREIDSETEPKVRSFRGHCRGCFGDVRDLDETSGPVVVVEGVFDYLTALQIFADHLPFGAHGAGRILGLVEMLVPWIAHRGLWLAPHPDAAGKKATMSVIELLRRAGIASAKLQLIALGGGDLNDVVRSAT